MSCLTFCILYHRGARGVFSSTGAVASWSPSAEPQKHRNVPQSVATDGAGGAEPLWRAGALARHFPLISKLDLPLGWTSAVFFGGDPLPCSSLLRSERFLVPRWGRLTDAQKSMQDPSSPRLNCPRSGQAQTPARTSGVDTTPQASAVETSPIFAPLFPANAAEVTTCLVEGR